MLETVALPKMLSFTDLVNKLEKSHDEMREAIRHFDEDLCTKASKAALLHQKE